MTDSLRKKTLNAVLWSGIGQYGSQGVRLAIMLILASLLPPSDFGLLGLATIFLNFAQGIGELGLAAAVVQKLDAREPTLSTAFWANMGTSIVLAAVTFASAETVSTFMGADDGGLLLQVLSVIFPLTALSTIPRALLQKQLNFRALSLQRYLSEIGFGLVGVGLALTGFSVWSLIGAVLAHRLAGTLALWFSTSWRPCLQFSRAEWSELFHFGGPYMAGALAMRGIAHIDYFVVGHWFGTAALGYYTLAFQLAILPQERFVGMLRQVAFPALAMLKEDPQRLRLAFLKGLNHLFAGLLPVCILISVAGPWFIRAAYGDKWAPAIPALRILGVAGLFYVFDVAQSVYFALGKPGIRLQLTLLRLALFIFFVSTYGISHGIAGVALSLLLSVSLSCIAAYLWLNSLIRLVPRDLSKMGWLSFKGACCALLPLLIMSFLSQRVVSPWWVCLWLALSTLGLYGAVMFPVYKDLCRLVMPSRR